MDCRRIGDQPVKAVKNLAAVRIELIEGTGPRQHLKWPLSDPFQIHAARHVKQRRKGFVTARIDDQLHRLTAHILERAKPIDQFLIHNAEFRQRAIHAGRNDLDFQPSPDLFGIDRQFVGQVDIAIHHA